MNWSLKTINQPWNGWSQLGVVIGVVIATIVGMGGLIIGVAATILHSICMAVPLAILGLLYFKLGNRYVSRPLPE